jgi:hypothetical protein
MLEFVANRGHPSQFSSLAARPPQCATDDAVPPPARTRSSRPERRGHISVIIDVAKAVTGVDPFEQTPEHCRALRRFVNRRLR